MLCIENITVEWKHDLLCHASACFYEGQITGIIGDNGCGKTTLIYCLALLKRCEGCYIYDGKEIDLSSYQQRDDFRYHHIFVLLQELSLYDEITLKDYLHMMSHEKMNDNPFDFPMEKKLKQFSLGEKQLLLLYGGYLQDKDIYLLDEPTASLDKNVKKHMMHLFDMMKQQGKIIIIITHDQEILDYVDCLYEFKNQQLLLQKDSTKAYPKTTQTKHCQFKDMFFIQLRTPSFLHRLCIVLGLSLLLMGVTCVINQYTLHSKQQITNGQRQAIIVYSDIHPELSSQHITIEPYYQYHYQNLSFSMQDIPLTPMSKQKMDDIIYYQYDHHNYIKEFYSQLTEEQVGYIISFDDVYEYASLMKEIQQVYPIEQIESHYLEKDYRQQLSHQMTMITLLERMIIFFMMIFISLIDYHRFHKERIENIMLLDVIGFSRKQKICLFIMEIIIVLVLSFVMLWDCIERVMMCFFVFMIFKNDFFALNKEMASLYRQV